MHCYWKITRIFIYIHALLIYIKIDLLDFYFILFYFILADENNFLNSNNLKFDNKMFGHSNITALSLMLYFQLKKEFNNKV